MRLIYTTCVLLMSLMASAQFQQTAEGIYIPPCQECYSIGPELSSITLGQYNVTFNFSGMNEYKLDGCVSPRFLEPDPNSKYQQQSYGWSGQAKFSIKQHENNYIRDSKISLEIGEGVAGDLITLIELQKELDSISKLDPGIMQENYLCRGSYNCGIEKIENISWRSYQNENEEKRPIPKRNFYFDAVISQNESIEIKFENVSRPIVDQFMQSLNITGLGIYPTVESWDDYVARVRRPSEGDPGISALQFIDKMYSSHMYDFNNSVFIKIDNVFGNKVSPIKEVEAEAIRYHYYGPIPLPRNVSLDAPNGDEVPKKEPKVNATAPKNSIFNESNLIQWGQGPVMDRTASMDIFYRVLNANESEYNEYHYQGDDFQNMVTQLELTSDPRIVDVLINALKKNPYRNDNYNEDIVDALSRFGKLAVDPLIQVLLDENTDPITRSLVADTIGYIGQITNDATVLEPLIMSLKYGDDNYAIKRAIERMEGSSIDFVDQLISALKNENPLIRENIAIILSDIGDSRATDPLKELHKDEDSNVRESARKALASFGISMIEENQSEYMLVQRLIDENNSAESRKEAARLLMKIGSNLAIETLIKNLNDKSGPDYRTVGEECRSSLAQIGKPAVESLIQALKDNDSGTRMRVAATLGYIDDTRVINPLIQAMGDKNSKVREEANAALGMYNLKEYAVEPLIQALKDNDSTIREGAASALGRICSTNTEDKRAVDPLIQALKDQNSSVRKSAASALGSIRDKQAVEPLIQVLKEDKDPEVRGHAASALGRIGDERAIEPLNDALKSQDMRVKINAEIALKELKGYE